MSIVPKAIFVDPHKHLCRNVLRNVIKSHTTVFKMYYVENVFFFFVIK